MSFIDEVRSEREDLARVLKKHLGIRKIVEELYPDNAHFIYELLQNAEDTGATEARFTLTTDSLAFEHNGRAFEAKDIYGITDIGEGTKAEDNDKIGRFGVGFKAVFAYSETPHIWSPTFAFKISDLVLPSEIAARKELGSNTRFEFPFNNPKKSPVTAYEEIKSGLVFLPESALLFLGNIKSITWSIGEDEARKISRVQHSDCHIELIREVGGKITGTHFLQFRKPVENLPKQYVAIAFNLDFLPKISAFRPDEALSSQFRITPATPGRVSVFFPAEKETSGLRFHLHAPFVPELSRASIKETPANSPLYSQLAALVAASLHGIRDLGLLTGEFLATLPNPQDAIPQRYQPIRAGIVNEMNNHALTPTYTKSHAPAKILLQAKAALKELLSENDIEFLVPYSGQPPLWAISTPQKNSNADRFLGSLAIEPWDIEDFVELLTCRMTTEYSGFNGQFMEWLAGHSIEWHQQFYALLYKDTDEDLFRPRDLKIICIGNGNYDIGSKCFFPMEGNDAADELLYVDASVYSSGKSKQQQDDARQLLKRAGVREAGETELVDSILKQRYTKENFKPKKQDINRFIKLVEMKPDQAKLFGDYFIFEVSKGSWQKPKHIFLDQPYKDTGLNSWYSACGKDAARVPLYEGYHNCGIKLERLAKFAEAVGVQTKIEIQKVSCRSNSEAMYLVYEAPGKKTDYEVDDDYYIDGIERALSSESFSVSKLIWNTLAESHVDWTTARYCKNYTQHYRIAPSRLALILKSKAWVPQGNDTFVCPGGAVAELLPDGFAFDKGWRWLKGIGFAENNAIKEQERVRLSQEKLQRESLAKGLGFDDDEALNDAQWFSKIDSAERQRIKDDHERKQKFELPDSSPRNPQLRAERVGQQALDAPERKSELRTRSVSVGRDDVKKKAAQYLHQQYTNDNGEMICQVCQDALPFKLADDSYYFEKVEFLPDINNRHYQNYLALCPNHAAMYQHANGSVDKTYDAISELVGNELEIVLAGTEHNLYFTKTHIADMKQVIETDMNINAGDDQGSETLEDEEA